jgi:Ni/Co efflux regulator RcnB
MKTRWWMAACGAALLALTGSAAAAQGRGQREQDDRNRENHSRFDDHDQEVTHNWYQQHHNNAPAGFRDRDRLSSDDESRLRVGSPVDSRLRTREHRVPRDLSRQLDPPPRHSRYVAIGGHVAQVDRENRVQDVIHLEANF